MDKHRIFIFTYGTANAGLILYGLLALADPGILLDPFSSHVFEFPVGAASAFTYLAALFRLLGYFNLLLGSIGLLLLWQYQINRQSWLFHTVMVASLLSYLAPIVFDNTVGHIGFFEILEHIVFFTMVVAAMIMLRERKGQ